MAAASGHLDREQPILNDVEVSFPDFTGQSLAWVHNTQDPPDFIAQGGTGPIGLELREWLDGQQMSEANGRERQRARLTDIIGTGWEQEYQPKNFALASIELRRGLRIAPSDESRLRQEFYACAMRADQSWFTNPERIERGYCQMEFTGYPLMEANFQTVRYTSGPPLGALWVQVEEDAGAYDPNISIQTLEEALEDKLAKFSRPESQAKIASQNLSEHYLLIHGGWNAYRSNTPYHPLTLEQIARHAAELYAAHPPRALFNRVWFFDSLDSADEVNALFGLPAGSGRVRWLAQLWPTFRIY